MPRSQKRRKKVHVRNQLHHHDKAFVDRVMPFFEVLEKYFRYEVLGLENIPLEKGCLVVMNHGIIPYHGFLFTKTLIEECHIYPRGMGAGFLFDLPYVREFFLKGGAVNANPINGKKLLAEDNCVLLAPGGIYEGLVCQPKMRRIPWERRKGFVELAIQAKKPIVPTYCHGINEVYFNSKFLLKKRIKWLEAYRFSVPLFLGFGLLPLPRKLIHTVGEPISVKRKRGETKKEQIDRIHRQVIESMQDLAH